MVIPTIRNRSRQARIELVQSLFTDYPNLGITDPRDRPVAIDSLAIALANALDTNVRYGIVECFLHRNVLWQRPQNIPLGQILFAASKAPPSWSWIAYYRQIQYLQNITFGNIKWDKSVQIMNVKQFIKVNYC
jgi:hypothetical protein